ncbi:hypothetical protein BYT27DRAFT_7257811, partial [Phlegmacium glaucopus]
ITKLPYLAPTEKKKVEKPKLRRTNLTAEQAALANPPKVSNRAFLTLNRQSSPPEHTTQYDDHPASAMTSPSRHTSPSSATYQGDRATSPSTLGEISSSHHGPSLAQAKKPAKSIAKFQDGAVIGKRAKAADYEDVVSALLIRAMFDYEGLVSTHDAFPDISLCRQWTLRCWKQALKDADEWIEISDRMITLVKKRGSRIRGHIVSCVRPQIIATYGFIRKATPQAMARNRVLYEKLILKGAFHYKDPDTMSGFAQNKIISEILYLAWFEDKRSQGPVLSEYFNPITLETLSLIFTMIDFCLREWSTGAFLQATFFEKDVIHAHKIYRVEVKTWSSINFAVTLNIRKKLFSRALRNAGVVDEDATIISGLVGEAKDRVQTELDGRTGDTDSELSDGL